MQYHFFAIIDERAGEALLSISESKDMSMLETVTTIISIAVSVWIGLNIYNVYRREDLDSALEIVQNSLNELNYEGNKRKFICQLEKGENMYEINKFFCVEFEKEDNIPVDILMKLSDFEKQFSWCYMAYEKDRWNECAKLADILIADLWIIERMLRKHSIEEETVIYTYVHIRKADLLFYKNMTGEKGNKEEYLESIELYKKELNAIPSYETELRGYMENTIGYTYFLLLKMSNNYKGNIGQIESRKRPKFWKLWSRKSHISELKNESEGQISENIIDDYKKEAVFFMERAVKDNPKGRYIQNLGAYYEIIVKNYDKAKTQYIEASRAVKKDGKIYNLLGAVLLKWVDQTLGIDRRFYDKDESGQSKNPETLAEIALKLKNGNDTNKKECVQNAVRDAYVWLHFALKQNEPIKNAYYNYSKACFYYYLFVSKRNSIDMLKEAKTYLEMIYIFQKNVNNQDSRKIGMLYTYRNFYEAKQDYKHANEINDELSKMDDSADIRGARELYNKKINSGLHER